MKKLNKSRAIHSTAELAQKLGVSRWTVSRALNGQKGVGAETVKAVADAMRTSGFRPNSLAQGLRRGRTDHIGVCVPNLETFHLGPKIEVLRRELETHGFRVILGMSNDDAAEEARVLQDFAALRVAGISTFASRLSEHEWARLTSDGTPGLRIDPLVGPEASSLGVDRAYGMREATQHLLALGHRHLILLGIDGKARYSRARLRGVRLALRLAKLPFEHATLSVLVDKHLRAEPEQGYAAAGQVAQQLPKFRAVLVINDRMATGLIAGLCELGLRVPEDISVVGYDNMPLLAYAQPALTSVDPNADELMSRATALLLAKIRGEQTGAPERVRARLVVRHSTGPRLQESAKPSQLFSNDTK
ncbi:MAG: LacI family DNA-binding transcriptional regulator [Polyangiaceae bacterium]|nr:LacI family DNA-binding transcriptional regulator [Polyangiaceae bacterium]